MKPDLYTKAVLTVIAIMLSVIASKPIFNPDTTASAQTAFAGMQMTGANGQYFSSMPGAARFGNTT